MPNSVQQRRQSSPDFERMLVRHGSSFAPERAFIIGLLEGRPQVQHLVRSLDRSGAFGVAVRHAEGGGPGSDGLPPDSGDLDGETALGPVRRPIAPQSGAWAAEPSDERDIDSATPNATAS